MKFEDIPLVIPSLKALSKKYDALIEELENAKTANDQIRVYKKIMRYDDHVETMFTVISIRYSLDTTNEEYVKANDVLDEIAPQVQVFSDRINRILVSSPFRKELEEEFGPYLFKQIDMSSKCFDPKIIEDLQLENITEVATDIT